MEWIDPVEVLCNDDSGSSSSDVKGDVFLTAGSKDVFMGKEQGDRSCFSVLTVVSSSRKRPRSTEPTVEIREEVTPRSASAPPPLKTRTGKQVLLFSSLYLCLCLFQHK
jgi:hypothetical protein